MIFGGWRGLQFAEDGKAKLSFELKALHVPLDPADSSSMLGAFVLIFAMSVVVFGAVWLISTALATPSP